MSIDVGKGLLGGLGLGALVIGVVAVASRRPRSAAMAAQDWAAHVERHNWQASERAVRLAQAREDVEERYAGLLAIAPTAEFRAGRLEALLKDRYGDDILDVPERIELTPEVLARLEVHEAEAKRAVKHLAIDMAKAGLGDPRVRGRFMGEGAGELGQQLMPGGPLGATRDFVDEEFEPALAKAVDQVSFAARYLDPVTYAGSVANLWKAAGGACLTGAVREAAGAAILGGTPAALAAGHPALTMERAALNLARGCGAIPTEALPATFYDLRSGRGSLPPGSRLNLAGVDLTNADMHRMNLEGANLRGVRMANANLAEANLQGADLRESNLVQALFEGANLRNADLTQSSVGDASFREADLRGAHFNYVDAGRAIFDSADLRGADMQHLASRNASFDGADLRGTDFTEASLSGTTFRDAKFDAGTVLDEASLYQAELNGSDFRGFNFAGTHVQPGGEPRSPNLSDTSWIGAHLEGANLTGVKLKDARLYEAHLDGVRAPMVNLFVAELARASLRGADLRFADLRGANFADADLSGADLTGAQVGKMYFMNGSPPERGTFKGVRLTGANLNWAATAPPDLENAIMDAATYRRFGLDRRYDLLDVDNDGEGVLRRRYHVRRRGSGM